MERYILFTDYKTQYWKNLILFKENRNVNNCVCMACKITIKTEMQN